MISDARSFADGTELQADVCIAGGGAAGITLALELQSAGLSVILLESGSYDSDPNTQALYTGRMSGVGNWKLDEMRARYLGGSTNLWNGFCRPLQPEDFEVRSYIGGDGWPFTYQELLSYYPRAHDTLSLGGFDYDAASIAQRMGLPILPFETGVVETRMYQFSPPTRFGVDYRSNLVAAENLQVVLSANLRTIRLTGPGGTVSRFECLTLSGVSFTVTAARYVLALGGLENARLLLASNAEQPEGVANSSGLVGRFMEHPHYYYAVALLFADAPDIRFYGENPVDIPMNSESRTVTVRGALGLTPQTRAAAGLPGFSATLDVFDPSTPTGDIPSSTTVSLLGRSVPVAGSQVRLTCRCEQSADANSRVTLIPTQLDALGMPRIDLHWDVREEDVVAMKEACALMGRELGRVGLGRVWAPPNDWLTTIYPGGHHLGTTRMSVNPSTGVVDGNGRTHDVANLYVAGSSTFSSGGDSNPTLTVVALAHRLADHLKGLS